jgi:type IV pilus assembly protein PilB
LLVVAQRLVRTLCPHCKTQASPAHQAHFLNSLSTQDKQLIPSALLQHPALHEAMGCALCMQGYKGRIGIYQMMPVDDALQHLMLEEASLQSIAKYSQQAGHRTLRQAGYIKALQGLTSWEEIMAHTA